MCRGCAAISCYFGGLTFPNADATFIYFYCFDSPAEPKMCLFNVSRCQYHGPSNCPEVASMFGEKGVIGLAKEGLLNIDTASTRGP